MTVDVRVVIHRTPEILRAIDEMTKTRVMVGIPAAKKDRKEKTPANNALIGYVHEHGSPAKHIPPRPWLRPGVKNAVPSVIRALKVLGKASLAGDKVAVDQGYHAVGLLLQNAVRAKISSNIQPPLAASTIRNRRRRSAGSKYRRKATTAADTRTLVDTGQLRNAITYIVRKVP
jgi:hypothetical protein